MDFGQVLSRAWGIIWKHKVLWIFGILAGCSGSSGGSGNFRLAFERPAPPPVERFFNQFGQLPDWQITLIVGVIVLIILLLVVLAIFLGTVGRVGLVRGTFQAEDEAETLVFGELFSGSLPYFWRVFGLNLLIGLAWVVAFILIFVLVAVVGIATLGIGLLCLLPLLCLLVPLIWFVNLVVEQAIIAIVVEDAGIGEGLQRGWDVFTQNFGSIFVMGLILLVVNLVGGFILGLPFAIVVLPAIIGGVAGTQQALGGGFLVAAICFTAYLPFLLVFAGALRSYIGSAWTLTYLRLTRPPETAEVDLAAIG
jgi:hypothetical protein